MAPLQANYVVKGIDFGHVWAVLLRATLDKSMTPVNAMEYVAALALVEISDDEKAIIIKGLKDIDDVLGDVKRKKIKEEELKINVPGQQKRMRLYDRFLFALHKLGIHYIEEKQGTLPRK